MVNGMVQTTGGTSAVAPLYAGLVAVMNSLLRSSGALYPVGFANPLLYQSAATVCRDVTAASGPTNNTYDSVAGYTAGAGWDACTGLGSIDGDAFLNAHRPLSVSIRRRTVFSCDPGPVDGSTATFVADTIGGIGKLSYQWTVTNAQVAKKKFPGPFVTKSKELTIIVPPAGTVFTLQVMVTDPYRASAMATSSFKALDPTFAGFLARLCQIIHQAEEFRPPIYVNPGDPYRYYPYSPADFRRFADRARTLAKLGNELALASEGLQRVARKRSQSLKA
jgi:hypothetical protein